MGEKENMLVLNVCMCTTQIMPGSGPLGIRVCECVCV